MKWNDAEKVMAKLEELYADREVSVVSSPTDGPPDDPMERNYSVEVFIGISSGGDQLVALAGIAAEVECDLALAPNDMPSGINAAFS